MNQLIFPEDVDNVIQSFCMEYKGNEDIVNLLLSVGAELLDVSPDTMAERI